jgi:uncharacterized membrane protein YuzA (DUF378 family)
VLDFDQITIVVAAILAALSLRQFRIINIVLLLNFILFEITSHYILAALDGKPAMILHAAYVLIGGLTVISLVKLKASPPLFVTAFLFSVYNLSIVSEFVFFGSVGFHDNFIVVAQAQMIIELLIMFLMSRGGLYVCRGLYPKSNYIHFVDRFFRSGIRVFNRGIA